MCNSVARVGGGREGHGAAGTGDELADIVAGPAGDLGDASGFEGSLVVIGLGLDRVIDGVCASGDGQGGQAGQEQTFDGHFSHLALDIHHIG